MIPLPPPLTGDHPLVAYVNRLRECIQQAQVTDVKNGVLWHGAQGTQIVCAGKGGGGGSVDRYRLKKVEGDYLACKTWDGSTEGSVTINIAKPWHLRESLTSEAKPKASGSGTDTHTYTYSDSADTTTPNRVRTDSWLTNSETLMVAPPWVVDENIYAIDADTGITSPSGITQLMVGESRQWSAFD